MVSLLEKEFIKKQAKTRAFFRAKAAKGLEAQHLKLNGPGALAGRLNTEGRPVKWNGRPYTTAFQEVKHYPTDIIRLLKTDPGLIDRLIKREVDLKARLLNPYVITGNLPYNQGGSVSSGYQSSQPLCQTGAKDSKLMSNLRRVTKTAIQSKKKANELRALLSQDTGMAAFPNVQIRVNAWLDGQDD